MEEALLEGEPLNPPAPPMEGDGEGSLGGAGWGRIPGHRSLIQDTKALVPGTLGCQEPRAGDDLPPGP